MILKYEEFIHADFKTELVFESLIILKSEQAPIKDCKESFTTKNFKKILEDPRGYTKGP